MATTRFYDPDIERLKMTMLRISLRNSLIGLAALTVGLSLAEGYVGLSRVSTVAGGGTALYDDIIPGISFANGMNTALGDLRIGEAEHLLAEDDTERATAEKQIAEAIEKISALSDKYGALIKPDADKERRLFKDTMTKILKYRDLGTKFLALSNQSRTVVSEQAKKMYMLDMKSLYDPTGDMIDQLIAVNDGDAAETDKSNQAAATSANIVLWCTSLGLLLIAIASGAFAMFGVSRPMSRLTAAMQAVAEGNDGINIPGEARPDELGAMARAFKNNAVRVTNLADEQRRREAEAVVQRKNAMVAMADQFEEAVGGIVSTVASSATEMEATAQTLTASTNETAAQSTAVAAAAEEAAANVMAASNSAEQFGASVGEIGRQVAKSSEMAQAASREAGETGAIVAELSQAAGNIGNVVDLISRIADQTNLLALNATIEAARAGEAGRGFAVVAAEVKELASQTAKATAEIGTHITSIQGTTTRAVNAISGIISTIQSINEAALTISGAVEEQSVATREIVSAVTQASTGAGEVTSNISGVARAAEETGMAATMVLTASSDLAKQGEMLRSQVKVFLDTVRAA